MLTKLWSARLKSSGIAVHAMHPGWALTPGVRTALPSFVEGHGKDMRSAEEGADTIVWLAGTGIKPLSTPAAEATEAARLLREGGGFWFDRRPVQTDFRLWDMQQRR